ncbi:calcium-independent phospholipase A2-gamma [Fusarium pseudocircinatum]|uniref:Calcium-independent phospholipase A2-gamma n=1 Tax=Fusarium pseudocircinatum TaxID=56676 RepID=A0A8H5L3W1_9HYPO|nr:calcium-independent phospholipase A2-gamma [Fusarium pseudocircinatum]
MNGQPPNSTNMSLLDEEGICMLSLDGGGVRGLSSLYVLKRIMDGHNAERKKLGQNVQKPADIFDLIGGTSTGGLIAIMLGRLKMGVDECISAYNDLIKVVFNDKARVHQSKISLRGQTGLSPTDEMVDSHEPGCKVFMCATSKLDAATYRFRSYTSHKSFLNATICQAARATFAAMTSFNPVSIGGMKFVDGVLGANNPADQVEEEAREIRCPTTGDLQPLVKCFISIGTGKLQTYSIEDRADKFIATLAKMATDVERTEETSLKRWRQHLDRGSVFRFNVDQGLQTVGVKEYKKKGEIQAATYKYLNSQVQSSLLQRCVGNLILKKKLTGLDFELTIAIQLSQKVTGRLQDFKDVEKLKLQFNLQNGFATAAVENQVSQVIKVDGLEMPDAIAILRHCLFDKGLLADEEILKELITELDGLPLSGETELEESIGILGSFFLLTPKKGGSMFDMPTIVHLYLRTWVQQKKPPKGMTETVTKRLNELVPRVNWSKRLIWKEYEAHAIRILTVCQDRNLKFDERFRLACKVGSWLLRERNIKGAIPWLQEALCWAKKSIFKHTQRRFRIQLDLAEAYAEAEQSAKAIQLAENGLEFQEKHVTKDDSSVLAVSCVLAKAHRYNGSPKKEIDRLGKLKEFSRKRNEMERLAVLGELGKCYNFAKEYDKAAENLELWVDVARSNVAKDDPILIIVKIHLAYAYGQQGQHNEAISILEEAFPIQERNWGKSHSDTIITRSHLANQYLEAKKLAKAISVLEKLVPIQSKTLGQMNRETMLSENLLVKAYFNN